MRSRIITLFAAALIAFGLAACGTPPGPKINYPVTYQINLSNTQVVSNAGPQSTKVTASQEIAVVPSRPLYLQIAAPMEVQVYIWETSTGGSRYKLGELRGGSISSTITPRESHLEFQVSATQPNTGGIVQLTISDRPFATAVVQ